MYFQAYDVAQKEGCSPGGENGWTEAVQNHTPCKTWTDTEVQKLENIIGLQDVLRREIENAQNEFGKEFPWTSFIFRGDRVRIMVPDDNTILWLRLVLGDYFL